MSGAAPTASVREYFDENVREWDTLRYEDETYRSRGRSALRWLAERPLGRVLDLGCGTGHQTLAARRLGHVVVSADFSFEMARATRDRVGREDPGSPAHVVVADVLHPPFRPGTFDTVLALGVLGFVPDRPGALKGIHSLLRESGELIADVGVPEDQVLFQRWSRWAGRVAGPVARLIRRALRRPRDDPHPPGRGFYASAFVKHRPVEYERLLRSTGFEPRARAGAGFGDLQVLGVGLVPWRLQMAAARALGAWSRRRSGGWLARRALIYVVRSTRTSGPEWRPAGRGRTAPAGVLFVANFPPGTGYAWSTIEQVFDGIARRLSAGGIRTFVAYPGAPTAVAPNASPLALLPFDYRSTRKPRGTIRFLRLLRAHDIRLLYLTDLETWSWRYALFRLAGVRSIVFHDRTSGARHAGGRMRRAVKRVVHRIPALAADRYIGVSDFVAKRLVEVNGAPACRVVRVHNGIDLTPFAGPARATIHAILRLPPSTRIVFFSGRARRYKGFHVVLDAAARFLAAGRRDVAFVYCGDGPDLSVLLETAMTRGLRNVHFLGRRSDVADLLRSAAVAVVPSLWDEAFGLTVVEAMAAGVPLVASRVGGIPELVDDGRSGLLVPPGDVDALVEALRRILDDPILAERLATEGRARAHARFGIERTVEELAGVVERAMVVERVDDARPAGPRRRPDPADTAPRPAATEPAVG